jgi:hypothetical protein
MLLAELINSCSLPASMKSGATSFWDRMKNFNSRARRAHSAAHGLTTLLRCLLVIACGASCKHAIQHTSYSGEGEFQGSPPLCYQHREESKPGPYSRSLLVHLNNTCGFAVDCWIYNDVTEQEQRVILLAKRRAALLVATGTDETMFDVELDCAWQG